MLGHRRCGGFGARWASGFSDGILAGPLRSALVMDHFTQPVQVFGGQVMGPGGMTLARASFVGSRTTTLYGYGLRPGLGAAAG